MGHAPAVFGAKPFKRAVFKCTQATTAAPAIGTTILNELDAANPVLTRTSAGLYVITLAGAFTATKTFCRAKAVTPKGLGVVYTSADVITIQFTDLATPTAADSGNFDLEIDVYF